MTFSHLFLTCIEVLCWWWCGLCSATRTRWRNQTSSYQQDIPLQCNGTKCNLLGDTNAYANTGKMPAAELRRTRSCMEGGTGMDSRAKSKPPSSRPLRVDTIHQCFPSSSKLAAECRSTCKLDPTSGHLSSLIRAKSELPSNWQSKLPSQRLSAQATDDIHPSQQLSAQAVSDFQQQLPPASADRTRVSSERVSLERVLQEKASMESSRGPSQCVDVRSTVVAESAVEEWHRRRSGRIGSEGVQALPGAVRLPPSPMARKKDTEAFAAGLHKMPRQSPTLHQRRSPLLHESSVPRPNPMKPRLYVGGLRAMRTSQAKAYGPRSAPRSSPVKSKPNWGSRRSSEGVSVPRVSQAKSKPPSFDAQLMPVCPASLAPSAPMCESPFAPKVAIPPIPGALALPPPRPGAFALPPPMPTAEESDRSYSSYDDDAPQTHLLYSDCAPAALPTVPSTSQLTAGVMAAIARANASRAARGQATMPVPSPMSRASLWHTYSHPHASPLRTTSRLSRQQLMPVCPASLAPSAPKCESPFAPKVAIPPIPGAFALPPPRPGAFALPPPMPTAEESDRSYSSYDDDAPQTHLLYSDCAPAALPTVPSTSQLTAGVMAAIARANASRATHGSASIKTYHV